MTNPTQNLAVLKKELASICQNCGRDPSEISLVAITKGHSVEEANELIKAGVKKIGENRLQEALAKLPNLLECEKHFVGSIQSNKAREIARHFDVVQSVGSVKVARILNDEAAKIGKILPIFLQVNLAKEFQKSGFFFFAKESGETSKEISKLNNLKVKGLMVIGIVDNEEKTRRVFAQAKKLNDRLGFKNLSAGMSNDWKIAIEEGANFLRVGRRLFKQTIEIT